MNSFRFAGIAALLAAGLAGCGTAPQGLQPATTTGTEAAASRYLIGPGDTLSVFVYRAPELGAADLPVRPDGRISLPLVPDIDTAGRTPTELARAIEEALKEFVIDPNVTVMVRSFVGQPNRQIRVIGEATQPLAIPYREGMSVLDVMINARGLTRYAAGNRAEIIRRPPGGAVPQAIPVRLDDLLRGGDISQDMAMQPGDTLVIPQGWF
ncbi:XrtA/PEP-CTERM system exopolysaccharide export protein [Falsiroseomonas selenitidurans]|uniref:Sugar ABC transporter substrate-binding protein n=1 Tax=Falsiroseomonas selenitidurans TaxID=2716335 RepID=A0ABX1E088_9PROT|nr:XrtA/PEP-CTERM system exopolysaccharide export protein [Falsiroseomonas selenitidurans]NKC30560.1 sugar ABC transporter substrate-binding protein [Falsiroseomonas selenitidurans]